ncbi:hypothetical protein DQ04_00191140 [Trypanosoma grayi]|uniref:hypothetical protein n=1 Tax=Trypanosoma grayi TaxID=71804 RepID=UPI0004F4BABD|nr:hypothetical protein DQ04_00191140 [Trypanosoma grayi]KEG15090.1 hypothetical protein DQ04_00191140 [Trypanosoma grayi]
MLRRTMWRLGGGGGDLFPTTKEAAHLTPSWVMARHPPPPPGQGKCYVSTTRPAVRSKWQLTVPEVHTLTVAQLDAPTPRNAVLPRPSGRVVKAALNGVNSALSHKPKPSLSGIAAVNIAAKKYSEARMKTRDYAEHQRPARLPPGWERTSDVVNLSEWMYKRIHDHRKCVSDNKNGYEKEYMFWEAKPAPPQVKK